MYSIQLGAKEYRVDRIPTRALMEIDEARGLYLRMAGMVEDDPEAPTTFKRAVQVMVEWLVLFFGNQFTADDVYDNYPANKIVEDVARAMAAALGDVDEELKAFPTGASAENSPSDHTATWRLRFMTRLWKTGGRRRK